MSCLVSHASSSTVLSSSRDLGNFPAEWCLFSKIELINLELNNFTGKKC
jgi:hypothetical protein